MAAANMFFPVAASHQFIPGVYNTSEFLPYEIEEDGDVTYTRYTEGSVLINPRSGERKAHKDLIIKKTVTTSGTSKTTKYEKAYAMWADRKSAEYIPISRSFTEKENFISFQ